MLAPAYGANTDSDELEKTYKKQYVGQLIAYIWQPNTKFGANIGMDTPPNATPPTTKRTVADRQPPNNRSRVSNGKDMLAVSDGRTVWARRFRDVWNDLIDHVGGDAAASEVQRNIARRAALLTVELEQLENRFAEHGSDAKSLLSYGTISNTLRRLLADLGIQAKAKEPETLESYIARVHG
ncbi:MAG: hypothetical protein QM744_14360 [Mesorhizobium sp.]